VSRSRHGKPCRLRARLPTVDDAARVTAPALAPKLSELVDDLVTKPINRLIHVRAHIGLTAVIVAITSLAVPEIDVQVALLARTNLSREVDAHLAADVAALGSNNHVAVSTVDTAVLVGNCLESTSDSADEQLANLLVCPLTLDSVDIGVAVHNLEGVTSHAARLEGRRVGAVALVELGASWAALVENLVHGAVEVGTDHRADIGRQRAHPHLNGGVVEVVKGGIVALSGHVEVGEGNVEQLKTVFGGRSCVDEGGEAEDHAEEELESKHLGSKSE
jgi:hypothetical protein